MEAVGGRDGAAAESGAAAASDYGNAGGVGEGHYAADFVGVGRQDDGAGHRAVNGTVVLIDEQVLAVVDDIIVADDGADLGQEVVGWHTGYLRRRGRRRGRRGLSSGRGGEGEDDASVRVVAVVGEADEDLVGLMEFGAELVDDVSEAVVAGGHFGAEFVVFADHFGA